MRKTWMILAGIVAVGLLTFYYFSQERRFIWDEYTRFIPEDDEPFGSQLFDRMAEATLPNGYRVYDDDFEALLGTDERCALLLLYTRMDVTEDFCVALERFVKKGNKVMLVGNYGYLGSGTCFEARLAPVYYWGFSKDSLKNVLMGKTKPVSVTMTDVPKDSMAIPEVLLGEVLHMPEKAKVSSGFSRSDAEAYLSFYSDDDDAEESVAEEVAVVDDDENIPVMVDEDMPVDDDEDDVVHGVLSYEMQVGKGTAYVVAAPLLFTNYGVLDRNISRYLGYQMGRLANLPVTRVTKNSLVKYNLAHGGYNYDDDGRGQSPLVHLLGYRPLRWALYTLLWAVVIFVFFTARHRQREVPVVAKPVNRNMEFVRLLGTIYYRRHDNHDLFLKKYTYFKEELRRTQMIDLDDERMREGNARMLARRTGMEEEEVANTLQLLKAVADAESLGNAQLQECVQKIDDIMVRL